MTYSDTHQAHKQNKVVQREDRLQVFLGWALLTEHLFRACGQHTHGKTLKKCTLRKIEAKKPDLTAAVSYCVR